MKKLFTLFAFILLTGFVYSQTGPCIGSSSITISPPPDPFTGCYFPGTTVTVCVTINDYAQNGIDWLCGVVPLLGPGWDSTTLAPVSIPLSCDGMGFWDWYTTCTSVNSGITFGAGFFYDSQNGPPLFAIDSMPGNNFGDNCAVYSWVFCYQVTVSAGAAGVSGQIGATAYGDDLAGSWTQPGCVDPPITLNYCIANCTVTVPTVVTTDITTCFGDSTGAASVTPASGYPPYSYLWSNGATTQSVTGLIGGIYSVIVTDSSGCQKTVYLQIQQPQEINLNASVVGIGCGIVTTGSITTNANGGIAPYNYLWSTGATTSSISGLAIGTYTLTVTDSSGCTKTDSWTITTVPALNVTYTSTDETCGGNNGSATVAANGTPPYTYVWTPPVSTGPNATGLSQGVYIVQVTDSNGCSVTDTITINAIATFTVTSTTTIANCAGTGGSGTVTVNGNSGPYSYIWSPSGGTDSTAVNLNAGTYTVLITDTNNCMQTVTVVIPQLTSTVTVTTQVSQSACDSTSLATILATAGNGSGSYTYQWSNGATSQSITGLAAGTYTVTATDANQCSATATATILPFTPVSFTSTSIASCPNSNTGSAAIASTNGGTPPYSYSWSNGSTSSSITGIAAGTYTVTVTDASNCTASGTVTVSQNPAITLTAGSNVTICSGQSTTITAVAAGGTPGFTYNWSNSATSSSQQVSPGSTTTYTITVTDLAGCQATASVTVNVDNYPVISVTPDETICDGNSVSLSVSGGSSGTSYSWLPSLGLSNSSISNPVATPHSSTYYFVTASNGNCSTLDSVEITVLPSPQAIISIDSSNGALVNFTSNSTGGQMYIWDFGDGSSATTQNATHTYASGGIYNGYFVVTNTNGCTDTAFFTIKTNSSLIVYNVLTPNKDNHNDFWRFTAMGIISLNAEVYNRWGEKIFERNYTGGGLDGEFDVWDGVAKNGEAAPDGTYFYIITAHAIDKEYDLNGTITLIRKN
ncbi:MAG TPA: gliding motility-associated C-terminal domain-containing protein [Bacteroidia bacterium]|nr:gliding motility-associated C-terminal domain-containing protein [Bacteroidia bacterium]